MNLVNILLVIIAILSVALIITIIALVVVCKKLSGKSQQIRWYNITRGR